MTGDRRLRIDHFDDRGRPVCHCGRPIEVEEGGPAELFRRFEEHYREHHENAGVADGV